MSRDVTDINAKVEEWEAQEVSTIKKKPLRDDDDDDEQIRLKTKLSLRKNIEYQRKLGAIERKVNKCDIYRMFYSFCNITVIHQFCNLYKMCR